MTTMRQTQAMMRRTRRAFTSRTVLQGSKRRLYASQKRKRYLKYLMLFSLRGERERNPGTTAFAFKEPGLLTYLPRRPLRLVDSIVASLLSSCRTSVAFSRS